MADLHSTLASILIERYEANAASIHKLADQLSEDQFWKKPYPYGNSFGHLVLHLTGNLNYYIGAEIAKTGYVRDRPKEFNDPNPPSKEEALKRLDEAVAMVVRTLKAQSTEDWSAAYSGTGSDAKRRLDILLHSAAHMQHHIGQMVYLNAEWKRKG
jgi:uncharacterized damage-inducible protein DinB